MTFILALGRGSSGPTKEMERELKEIKLLAMGLGSERVRLKAWTCWLPKVFVLFRSFSLHL